MATLDTLVEDVYGLCYGVAHVERPEEDTLATSVADAADVEWQFDTDAMWLRGDYAEDQEDGELVILAEDHPSGADVTVRRGQRSTTAASSYAIGDVFYRNPLFPRYMIEKAVNETIDNDLYPNVWKWGTTTVSYTAGDSTYTLPSDCEDVTQIYQVDLGGVGDMNPLPDAWWEVMHGIDTALEASGRMLRLFKVYDSDATVYVTYRQRPQSSAISTTLSDELANMVPWKATAKLLAGSRIVPKSQSGERSPSEGGDRPIRDYVFFDTEFRRMRAAERTRLDKRVRQQARYRRGVRRG